MIASLALLAGCSARMREEIYQAQAEPVVIAQWTRKAPETVHVPTSDGLTLGGYFWRGAAADRDVIIFFHGRGAHQGVGAKYAEYLTGRGDHVLVASYRGFGGNPGTPSEAGLIRDGRAFVAEARALAGPDAHIFLAGHSLGGAVALHVALAERVSGVIAVSTFDRLEDAAPAYARPFLPDAWDNVNAVRKLSVPLVLVHGSDDTRVQLRQARQLFDAAHGPAALITIGRAGHKPQMDALGPAISEAVDAIDTHGLAQFPHALPPGWSVERK